MSGALTQRGKLSFSSCISEMQECEVASLKIHFENPFVLLLSNKPFHLRCLFSATTCFDMLLHQTSLLFSHSRLWLTEDVGVGVYVKMFTQEEGQERTIIQCSTDFDCTGGAALVGGGWMQQAQEAGGDMDQPNCLSLFTRLLKNVCNCWTRF